MEVIEYHGKHEPIEEEKSKVNTKHTIREKNEMQPIARLLNYCCCRNLCVFFHLFAHFCWLDFYCVCSSHVQTLAASSRNYGQKQNLRLMSDCVYVCVSMYGCAWFDYICSFSALSVQLVIGVALQTDAVNTTRAR